MDISNLQASAVGICIMLIGYGVRLKGYKISGDIAIVVGLLGIPTVIFYDKIYSFLKIISIEKYFAAGILICIGGMAAVIVNNLYRKNRDAKETKDKSHTEYQQGTNYISGKDLMAYWNMEGFELFNCLKKGLQPYTQYEQKLIDTDTLEHGRKHSVEWYEKVIRGTQETGTVVVNAEANVARRLTNQEIKQQAKKVFGSQRLNPINPPSHHMSYTFPDDNKKAAATIIKMMGLKFRKDEASKFAEKYGYKTIAIKKL